MIHFWCRYSCFPDDNSCFYLCKWLLFYCSTPRFLHKIKKERRKYLELDIKDLQCKLKHCWPCCSSVLVFIHSDWYWYLASSCVDATPHHTTASLHSSIISFHPELTNQTQKVDDSLLQCEKHFMSNLVLSEQHPQWFLQPCTQASAM